MSTLRERMSAQLGNVACAGAGLYLPRFLSDWFHTAVGLLK